MEAEQIVGLSDEISELEQALAGNPDADRRLPLLERLAALHRQADVEPRKRAAILHQLGDAHWNCGQSERAVRALRDAADLVHGDLYALPILLALGGMRCAMQDGEAAEGPLLEAIDLMRAMPRVDRRAVWVYNLLGAAQGLTGRNDDALGSLRQAAHFAQHLARELRSAAAAADWALMLNNVARTEMLLGRADDACATLETALATSRELVEARGSNEDILLHSAIVNRYGRALEATDRPGLALPLHEEAAEILRRLVAHGRVDLQDDLADVEADLARTRQTLSAATTAGPHL